MIGPRQNVPLEDELISWMREASNFIDNVWICLADELNCWVVSIRVLKADDKVKSIRRWSNSDSGIVVAGVILRNGQLICLEDALELEGGCFFLIYIGDFNDHVSRSRLNDFPFFVNWKERMRPFFRQSDSINSHSPTISRHIDAALLNRHFEFYNDCLAISFVCPQSYFIHSFFHLRKWYLKLSFFGGDVACSIIKNVLLDDIEESNYSLFFSKDVLEHNVEILINKIAR